MKALNPYELDGLPPDAAAQSLVARFRWLRRHRELLQALLAWQAGATPRPDFYFRWHLPRFIATLELLEYALNDIPSPSVLDLACYGPFAACMERCIGQKSCRSWTRTSLSGEAVEISCSDGPYRSATVALRLDGSTEFPFPSRSFDLVLLTEVVEHLNTHPQYTFSEINRVLKDGGRLLLTTPNVTSWKKILMLTGGDWRFDSPTFGGEWSHRYEYSHYDVRQMLHTSGFDLERDATRDVYFNDPVGLRQEFQFLILLMSKMLSGYPSHAAKLVARRGSGLLFLARKKSHRECRPTLHDLHPI